MAATFFRPYNFQQTDHPSIFMGAYWGKFKWYEGEARRVSARNAFVIAFGIEKCAHSLPEYVYKQMPNHMFLDCINDHVEVYATSDAFITVCSPYDGRSEWTEKLLDTLQAAGFYLFDNLYSRDSKTFVSVIPKGYRQNLSRLKCLKKIPIRFHWDSQAHARTQKAHLSAMAGSPHSHRLMQHARDVASRQRAALRWCKRRTLVLGLYLAAAGRAHVAEDAMPFRYVVRTPRNAIILVCQFWGVGE